MSGSKLLMGLGVVSVAGALMWANGLSHSPAQSGSESPQQSIPPQKAAPLANKFVAQAPRGQARHDPNQPAGDFVEDAIVIPNCQLNVDEKTELATEREGVILFDGRPIEKGEKVPADHHDTYFFAGQEKPYWKLKEGDMVVVNQVLARVDDLLARDEMSIKESKLDSANADLAVSDKTHKEAIERLNTQRDLLKTRATSKEEYRAAQLAVDKYYYEVISKKKAIVVAERELNQTKTVVEKHEIRSKINGQVKAIYKKKGESVKSLEPIFLIRNLDTLRAEGLVDVQYLPRLKRGTNVLVEPNQDQPHHQPFIGHLQPITGVAVGKDSKTIVSVSEDRTARVWKRGGGREQRVYDAGVALRSVACTPKDAAANYCAVGATDGTVRLYDLDADTDQPLRSFDGESKHRRQVNCIAFNKDGTICATGGDDREIHVWDVATGQLKFKLTDHHGPVTSLQFTPQDQLVSAGKDNAVMLWGLSADARPPEKIFPKRSGDVPVLGVSPDGKRVLYDPWQSKVLRVLSLPDGLHEGMIRNPSGTDGFKTLALFSPDGRFVLTGETTEGRLQLWTAPTESTRAFEVRRLTLADPSSITSAAFAPNGSFVVAGTKDRQVLAWGPLPSEKEVADFRIPAVISNIDRALDGGGHQVRIFAEFINPKGPDGAGILTPGGMVTLVVPPAKSIVHGQ